MSIERMVQHGGDSMEVKEVELRQLLMAVIFIEDVLGEQYPGFDMVRGALIWGWAGRHSIQLEEAAKIADKMESELLDDPFTYFMATTNLSKKGFISVLSIKPGKNEVLDKIQSVLKLAGLDV